MQSQKSTKLRVRPLILACVILAAFILKAQMTQAQGDALPVVEVVSIDGVPAPIVARTGALPRITMTADALVFDDLCYPSAVGTNGNTLGTVPEDLVFAPRPAVDCLAYTQESALIADAFARAKTIGSVPATNLWHLKDGDTVIMVLRRVD